MKINRLDAKTWHQLGFSMVIVDGKEVAAIGAEARAWFEYQAGIRAMSAAGRLKPGETKVRHTSRAMSNKNRAAWAYIRLKNQLMGEFKNVKALEG